MCQSLSEVIEL